MPDASPSLSEYANLSTQPRRLHPLPRSSADGFLSNFCYKSAGLTLTTSLTARMVHTVYALCYKSANLILTTPLTEWLSLLRSTFKLWISLTSHLPLRSLQGFKCSLRTFLLSISWCCIIWYLAYCMVFNAHAFVINVLLSYTLSLTFCATLARSFVSLRSTVQ